MRWSKYFLYTLKEDPAEAEAPSHKLLLRAGFIKQVSAGVYEILPAGYKVLKKVEKVIREEMDKAGAQELLLTVLNPAELWKETGRWEAYGNELFRLKDRNGREYCLGPTHEEEITDLVRKEISSYKQLPLILYQIQVKFRDEKRPRFGLIRGREFIMKDAYSFDVSEEEAKKSYFLMKEVYERIFKRLGIDVLPAEASVGTIGGKMSHEFIALTEYGEAKVGYCQNCKYCANAEIIPLKEGEEEKEEEKALKKVKTPGTDTIEKLSEFLKVPAHKIMKAILFIDKENKPFLVLLRGDREVDENKLEAVLGTDEFRMATDEEIDKILGTKKGFVGIFNLPDNIRVLWDISLKGKKNLVCALNEPDYHYINVNPGRDFEYGEFCDLSEIKEGDSCPKCGSPLNIRRGLELGHIFLLGTRYSEPMKAFFTDRDGMEKPIVMGCYGIGISRIISAIVEQYHDDKGIKWPFSVAPFEVDIILLNESDPLQKESAETLYREALERGLDVIYDDREKSPGFKFADAELVGFPFWIIVGKKVKEGKVEIRERHTGKTYDVEKDKAMDFLVNLINRR